MRPSDPPRELRPHGSRDGAAVGAPGGELRPIVREGRRRQVLEREADRLGYTIVPRSHLLLGESVCLRVTKYTNPCVNIAPAFQDENSARVSQKRNPGWRCVDARVLATGSIRASDRVWLPTDAEAARMRVPART